MATPYSDAVLADAPDAYWRLNESSGSSAVDSSANTNAGTIIGATLGGASPTLDTGAGSYSFDGVDDAISIAYDVSLFSTGKAHTMECWLRTTQSESERWIYQEDGVFGGLVLTTGGNLIVVIRHDVTYRNYTFAAGVNDGDWHHLVAVWDRSNGVSLYTDGSLFQTQASLIDADHVPGGTTARFIAARGTASYFAGDLAEVAYYNSLSLSPTRVAAHFAAASETPQTGNRRRRLIIGAS